jgi:superfamily II DNA/RNA helicase
VHGDLGQSQRERALRAFRSGKVDVLVATDVAARGLDVDDVTHVVNHECPEDDKAYLHRIGRTGRAGRTGVAVTFVDWQDMARWKLINETLKLGHPEPLETYSTSEHLFTALGIPAGMTGSLPNVQRARAGLEAEDLEDIGETGKSRSRQRAPEPGRSTGSGPRRPAQGSSGSGGSARRDPRRDDHTAADGHRAAQRDADRSRPARRRTRGGNPVAPADQAAEGSAATEPGADAPRKRRRASRGRSRSGRPASAHAPEGQRTSTRPADHVELRDISSDLSAVVRTVPQCPADSPPGVPPR